MTDMDDPNLDIAPLDREAIAWVRHLTSGQMTTADAEALRLWRGQSPDHNAAFLAASRLWKDLEPAGRDWRRRAANGSVHGGKLRRSMSMNRRFLLGGGLAAASVATVFAVIHPPLGLWPSWTELRADYRTGTGEQRDIALSADVSVRMNTQTSIAVRSADLGTDQLELIGGQASFVTRTRSLAVLASDRWITTNDAQFDVQHLHGRTAATVRVTCLKGRLNVEQKGDTAVLAAGQQLRYDKTGYTRTDSVDPDVASAWQHGLLIFRTTPLADVVEEINRYRPGRIVVVNSELGKVPVSGRFRIHDLDEILNRIEQAFGAKIRSLPGGLVLLS